MDNNTLLKALGAATQNDNELAQLVKYANDINFDCPDAKTAAAMAGDALLAKGTNEQATISGIGKAYEAILFTAMNKAGKIQVPNQAYANRIQNMYNQIIRLYNSTQQDQGRVQGNGQPSIFGNQSNNNLFSQPASSNGGGLFTKKDQGGSQSSLFGNKDDKPLFASQTQEEPSSSLFGAGAAQSTEESVATPNETHFHTGNKSMESLIAHETEAKLRSVCVTARQVSESIALYKDSALDEEQFKVFSGKNVESVVSVGGKRTPISIALVDNNRSFEIGEGETTARAIEALSNEIIKFNNDTERLRDADFSGRMVDDLVDVAVNLHNSVEAYAAAARENSDLNTLTATDATRAATAVTTELYRALSIAIAFAAEDKGLLNADGNAHVNFELDYSDFKEEIGQLRDFYASYEGKQSTMFELLFCQFARMLNTIRVQVDDVNMLVGRREIRVEMPYPMLDGVEVTPTHKQLDKEVMGENLDLITDLIDVIEKRMPFARVQLIDGLYRTGYIDRAYSTCRPKIVLQ